MSYRTALTRVLDDVVAPGAEVVRTRGVFPRRAVTALGRAGLLGLTVSAGSGGAGLGLAEAAAVLARTTEVCPATTAVLRSHYAAVAVVESYGGPWLRGEIGAGRHLCSLALAEDGEGEPGVGLGLLTPHATAERRGEVVALSARKHHVVAAGEADTYLWSTRPYAAPDGLSLWAVPAYAPDLYVPSGAGSSGPRGSGMSTVCADPVLVPADVMLGEDGEGLDILLRTVLPWLFELRGTDRVAAGGGGLTPARL
ncbi:acyl-CoA dehydrogenase family protein [Streptomyces sp. NPDC051940]|uniref:acyl-CoA dehydrogenase family protein n=1 Tax=Streptomyces sp. NPDC051940 TaxID=3155675 RepID=UPI00343D2A0F